MNLATGASAAGATAGIIIAVLAYWLPTFVALMRHIPAIGQVVVVNLFLGWTGIGWVVALVMAFRTPQPRVPAAYQPPQGPPADTTGYR